MSAQPKWVLFENERDHFLSIRYWIYWNKWDTWMSINTWSTGSSLSKTKQFSITESSNYSKHQSTIKQFICVCRFFFLFRFFCSYVWIFVRSLFIFWLIWTLFSRMCLLFSKHGFIRKNNGFQRMHVLLCCFMWVCFASFKNAGLKNGKKPKWKCLPG